MIYFDHNATTPLDKRVLEAMLPFLQGFYGNPSSLYKMGRVAKSAINTAREQLAEFVDAPSAQIIFTSGGTEANNLALHAAPTGYNLATSAIEHPSITDVAQSLHHKHTLIPVDQNGLIQHTAIEKICQSNQATFVSIMLANNESGTIQPVQKITQTLNHSPVIMHTDAVQAAGKIPISFDQLGVNLMSLSSHKIYGPKGCGALIMDKKTKINPLLLGGGQENGYRSGTENVAAIVGFGKAAELARTEFTQREAHLIQLMHALEQALKTIPDLVIFSEATTRLPNTIQFGIKETNGEMLLMQLDQQNIAVSSGSACAASGGKPSPVLTAMGIENSLATSALRVSLGKDNTLAEVNKFVHVLKSFIIPR